MLLYTVNSAGQLQEHMALGTILRCTCSDAGQLHGRCTWNVRTDSNSVTTN